MLSKILCQKGFGVEFGFKVRTEELVEGTEMREQGGTNAGPSVVIEVVGEEFHFNEGLALRMEVPAGIAAEVFDLIVDPFG